MTTNCFTRGRIIQSVLVAVLCIISPMSANASTYDFSYSGRLVDKEGKPLAGPVALKISFFHTETTTTSVLDVTQGIDNVLLKDGVFQVVLSLDGSDFQRVFPTVSQAVYIEVTDLTNASGAPYGRQRLTILPYAGKVPVDTSQFAWSSDGRLQLAVSGGSDSTAVATLSNKTIDATTNTITNISNSSISATAAIADSKLATISTAGKVSGGAITSGTIGGSTAVSTTGSVATSGKMAVGGAVGTSSLEVTGGGATSASSAVNIMNSTPSSLFYVRNDGNVGIGTTSPNEKLSILAGNASIEGKLKLYDNGVSGGSNYNSIYSYVGDGSTYFTRNGSTFAFIGQPYTRFQSAVGPMDDNTRDLGDSSYRWRKLYLSSDAYIGGNVGVGTTSPISKFHIHGTYDQPNSGFMLDATDTGDPERYALRIFPYVVGNDKVGYIFQTKSFDGGTNNTLALNNSGNVGIGTTSPGAKLHLSSPTTGGQDLYITKADSGTLSQDGGSIYFDNYHAAGNARTAGVNSGSLVFRFSQPTSGAPTESAYIRGVSDAPQTGGNVPTAITFGNAAPAVSISEKMRLSSDGNLGIGTSTPTLSKLAVNGSVSGTVGIFGSSNPLAISENWPGIAFNLYNDTGWRAFTGGSYTGLFQMEPSTGNFFLSSGNAPATGAMTSLNSRFTVLNGGNIGIGTDSPGYKLTVNGEPGANGYTAFTNYSDRRLKRNIKPISDGMLLRILALKPSSFYYNELSGYDEETRNRRINGFIAQELRDVFPEMVHETKIKGESYFDTNLSSLQIYLVKALQELKTHVDRIFGDHTKELKELRAATEALKLEKDLEIAQLKDENKSIKSYICKTSKDAPFCIESED